MTDGPDMARGKRDFSLTLLRLARLVGGAEALARRFFAPPQLIADWVLGTRVPDRDQWLALQLIARNADVTFTRLAASYVNRGDRRTSGIRARPAGLEEAIRKRLGNDDDR